MFDANVLVIDVGNSYTKIALFDKRKKIVKKISLLTSKFTSVKFTLITLKKEFKNYKFKLAILGSVVPEINPFFIKALNQIKINPYLINNKTKLNFKIDKKIDVNQVGNDILALTAYSATQGKDIVSFSFGTGLVGLFLFNNVLTGVSITLGLSKSINSLIQNASLINKNKYNLKKDILIGTNTQTALESGIYHLKNGFVTSFYESIRTQYKLANKNLKCIVVGFEIDKLDLNFKYLLNQDAILIGYYIIYELNHIP